MRKFEYRITTETKMARPTNYLNMEGMEGWELITIIEGNEINTWYWKREVIDKPQHEEIKQDAISKFSFDELQQELNRRYTKAIVQNLETNLL